MITESRDDKQKMVEDYVARVEEEFKDRAGGGTVEYWNPDIGEHLVKILPIEGTLDWCIIRARHYGVGEEMGESVLCPASISSEPCPICELRESLYRDARAAQDEEERRSIREEAKRLWPSKRYFACVYNFKLRRIVVVGFGAGVYHDISRLHKPKMLEEFPEYLERLTGGITLSSLAKDLVSMEPGVGHKILITKTKKAGAKDAKRDVEYTVQVVGPITSQEAKEIAALEVPDIRGLMRDLLPYDRIQRIMQGEPVRVEEEQNGDEENPPGESDVEGESVEAQPVEVKSAEVKQDAPEEKVAVPEVVKEENNKVELRKPKCFGTKEFEPDDTQCKECEFNVECSRAGGYVEKVEDAKETAGVPETEIEKPEEEVNETAVSEAVSIKERIKRRMAEKMAREIRQNIVQESA